MWRGPLRPSLGAESAVERGAPLNGKKMGFKYGENVGIVWVNLWVYYDII